MEEAFVMLRELIEGEIKLFAPDEQRALLLTSLRLVNELAEGRGRWPDGSARMLELFAGLQERRMHPGLLSQLLVFGTTTTAAAALDFVTMTREQRLPWHVDWQEGIVGESCRGLLHNHLNFLRLMGSWRCEALVLRPRGEAFISLRYLGMKRPEQAPHLLVPFPDEVEIGARLRGDN